MELPSPEQSPAPSDSTGGWQPVWDDESSVLGLRIDNSREFQDLVEDKEIAARAVAFVVNSTRKGIVPLCADVANLLRARKCLENKMAVLRSENESLRQSRLGSHAVSSPASLRSCGHDLAVGHFQERCCSRCSSLGSSVPSHSPRLPNQKSPRQHSGHAHPTSAFRRHQPHSSSTPQSGHGPGDHVPGHRRKGSLPEMVSEPMGHVTKVVPKTSHAGMDVDSPHHSPATVEGAGLPEDCHATECLQEQLQLSRQQNLQLQAELLQAHRDIQTLRNKLKVAQPADISSSRPEKFQMVNEFEVGLAGQENRRRSNERRPSATLIIPVILEGCRCQRCHGVTVTKDNNNGMSRNQITSSLQVSLDDHVVTKDNREGRVRYIGHVDDLGQTDGVYVGLELSKADGVHDGSLHGKRYFSCNPNLGVFVPVREVTVINRHPTAAATPQSDSPESSMETGNDVIRSTSPNCSDIPAGTSKDTPSNTPVKEGPLSLSIRRTRNDVDNDLV